MKWNIEMDAKQKKEEETSKQRPIPVIWNLEARGGGGSREIQREINIHWLIVSMPESSEIFHLFWLWWCINYANQKILGTFFRLFLSFLSRWFSFQFLCDFFLFIQFLIHFLFFGLPFGCHWLFAFSLFFLARERRMWKWMRYYHFNSAKFAPTLKIICIKRSVATKSWKKQPENRIWLRLRRFSVSRVFEISMQRIQNHHTTNAKPTDNLDQILCSAKRELNFIQRIILILMMILDIIWWQKWWLQINFRVLI